jgi:hypothetical protein
MPPPSMEPGAYDMRIAKSTKELLDEGARAHNDGVGYPCVSTAPSATEALCMIPGAPRPWVIWPRYYPQLRGRGGPLYNLA